MAELGPEKRMVVKQQGSDLVFSAKPASGTFSSFFIRLAISGM
jgi:hypothetical protein